MPVLIASSHRVGVQRPEKFVALLQQAQIRVDLILSATTNRPSPRAGPYIVDTHFECHAGQRSTNSYRAAERMAGIAFFATRCENIGEPLLLIGERPKMPTSIKRAKMHRVSRLNSEGRREVTRKAAMQGCSLWLNGVDRHILAPILI